MNKLQLTLPDHRREHSQPKPLENEMLRESARYERNVLLALTTKKTENNFKVSCHHI